MDNGYYYFGYEIMKLFIENENVYDGLRNVLHFIKTFTKSTDVILYQKNLDGSFQVMPFNNNLESTDLSSITSILSRIQNRLLSREYIDFNVQINSNISRAFYLKIEVGGDVYVLSLTNMQEEMCNHEILNLLKETLTNIIDKLKRHEEMLYNVNMDLLSGVNNRNLYEQHIKYFDNLNCSYVYALFDLFRLKYVNDNYGHLAGDLYIIKTAEILKKYFPQRVYVNDDSCNIVKNGTGSLIYRIGGDEFALIDRKNSLDFVNGQIQLVRAEVKDLDLGIHNKIELGINYGIAYHDIMDNAKDVFNVADEMLRDDKTKMYKKLGIDRRGLYKN